MQQSQRRLIGIPVRTRSGQTIGKVADFVLETDTGRMAFLVVRTRGLIPGLMDQELRIAWVQVISLSDKEAIVTDGTVQVEGTRLAVRAVSPSVSQKTIES